MTQPSPSMSKQEFAIAVLRKLRAGLPKSKILLIDGEDDFGLAIKPEGVTSENKIEVKVGLEKFYRNYCASGDVQADRIASDIQREVTRLADGYGKTPSFESLRAKLYPVIRRRSPYYTTATHKVVMYDPGVARLEVPFTAGACLGLTVDQGGTMMFVAQWLLDDWKISSEEVMAIALENLRAATTKSLVRLVPGLWAGDWRDGYADARLLLPSVIERVAVLGNHLILVPTVDTLLVVGDQDEDGQFRAIAAARSRLDAGDRAVSAHFHKFVDGKPVLVESKFPSVRAAMAGLQARFLAGDYETQNGVLHQHEPGLDGMMVPLGIQTANGVDIGSVALWREGGVYDLPLADTTILVFGDADGDDGDPGPRAYAVQTQTLMSTLPHLFELIDAYPPRVRVSDFPMISDMQKLNAKQVTVQLPDSPGAEPPSSAPPARTSRPLH